MSNYSNLRRNPFTGAYSYRVMDPEIHTIAELAELPGIYGFQLQDKPKTASVTVTENVTGGSDFVQVTADPAAGQCRIDYVAGYIFFNVADNGKSCSVDYEGGGTNMSKEKIELIVNNETRIAALEEDVQATGGLLDRMTAAESDIDSLQSDVQATGGLLDRMTAAESDILGFSVLDPNARPVISNNAGDANNDIDIAAGRVADSTFAMALILASAITKQIDAAWSAGTNAGGLDTGSVAVSTWYYVWLIRKDSDGSIDALFSLSSTAPNMPAGYTYKRRIGSVRTNASANIIGFFQVGNRFYWNVLVADAQLNNPGTSAVLSTLSVPPSSIAVAVIIYYNIDAYIYYGLATSPRATDSTATGTIHTHRAGMAAYDTKESDSVEMQILTDSSSRIRLRSGSSSANVYWMVKTEGWIDTGI